MARERETEQEELVRLEKELNNLKTSLPEHCYGREGYINVHSATPAQWQKIEDLEERIKQLKAQLCL